MADTRSKIYKPALTLLIVGLLICCSFSQRYLNTQREAMGMTRVAAIENAPPLLVFTTVALGGFRGIIANALWIRATEMQEEGRYFEMYQLADWITKLQPTLTTVWVHQAWNMAYNITVKFNNHQDRWTWVRRSIELLRDGGLKYNPGEPLIYREIGWIFQHKMGHYMDDANGTYKYEWAKEMNALLGRKPFNAEEFINPKTEDQQRRAKLLREYYKMEPEFMKLVDQKYGPLEWRLPETHAIYWGAYGLEKTAPNRLRKEDFITLRRLIFQGMQLAFHRGRLIYPDPNKDEFVYGPNLNIIKQASEAYLEQIELEERDMGAYIGKAHRNLIATAVYFLYTHNRINAAREWYDYLREKYPDYPGAQNKTVEEYAFDRIQEEVGDTDPHRMRAVLEGFVESAYIALATGDEDQAAGLFNLATMFRNRYMSSIGNSSDVRVGLPPLPTIRDLVLRRLLSPEYGMDPTLRLQLITKLNLPKEFVEDASRIPVTTGTVSTNAPTTATNLPTARQLADPRSVPAEIPKKKN